MSTRILILKDGVITPSRSSSDITAINTSLGITASLALKANLLSPALTGTPTAPTATPGTNTTQIANTAFVSTAISNLVNTSPAALDTLNELATALGNDPNFATTITNSLALKANLISPSFTTPNLGTPSAGILTNATELPLTGTTGTLAINRGGTGSTTQNFVDLTSPQTISNIKSFGPELRVVTTAYPKIVFHATTYGTNLKKFQMFVTPDGDFFFAPLSDAENISNGAFIIKNNGNIQFPSTTQATSTTTGGLVTGGGIACSGNIYAGGLVINFRGLPTSSSGLSSGSLWRNGNVVNIV